MSMSKRSVFASLTGEYANVGDGLIRRIALDWVRCDEGVTAFVGSAPDDWIEQMEFGQSDEILCGGPSVFIRWWFRVIFAHSKPIVLFEPGELTLARRNFPLQLSLLLLALVVRLRSGRLILPPRAITRRVEALPWKPTLWLHRLLCRLADVCLWRDQWSIDLARHGTLVPDTGFGADVRPGVDTGRRNLLLVSMRGARQMPPNQWCDGIRQWAKTRGFEIVTITQVKPDSARSAALALSLDGTNVEWMGSGPLGESKLREMYDQAALVISDRLHVLIISSLSGALPAEIAAAPTTKIASHFATIGDRNASLSCQDLSSDEISSWLDHRFEGREGTIELVKAANNKVRRQGASIRELLDERS